MGIGLRRGGIYACHLATGLGHLAPMSASPRHFSFHYSLKDSSGRLIDTSHGADPVTCVEGTGQIIDGLEAVLGSMQAGEKRKAVVPPERGYGVREAELVQKVPRARLPVAALKIGDQFQTGADRHAPVVTVVALDGDDVVLDANHPLAGQELHFDVELVSVRPARADDLPSEKTQNR